MQRRSLILRAAPAAAIALLAGCATFNSISVEVSSFGDWPAERDFNNRGTYAFDRLPSQPESLRMRALEDAAAAALADVGFSPAAAGAEPDFIVQVGARVEYTDPWPWRDPFWGYGGYGRWPYSRWAGPYWGLSMRYEPPRYDREVGLLIRDRRTGKPVYEVRATSTGYTSGVADVSGPMLRAALTDFPQVQPSPRVLRVQVP